MKRVDWDVFPYDSNVDDEYLSDALWDTDSDAKSFRKINMNKIIFAHLNINSDRNEFDKLNKYD